MQPPPPEPSLAPDPPAPSSNDGSLPPGLRPLDVELREIGDDKSRVVVIDGFMPDAGRGIEIAAGLAPFPREEQTYYPGLRRIITPQDRDAEAYVRTALERSAPFIGGAYDADTFDLLEASFSIVTRRPDELTQAQRAPHSDSTDPRFLAVLLYLHDIANTGTCFFRHRRTGFCRMTEDRAAVYLSAREQDTDAHGAVARYIQDSDADFERIFRVDSRLNRLVMYQGSLLHSAFMPEPFEYSPDPRRGRLTLNLFLRLHRSNGARQA